jgi:hypothetical protein
MTFGREQRLTDVSSGLLKIPARLEVATSIDVHPLSVGQRAAR